MDTNTKAVELNCFIIPNRATKFKDIVLGSEKIRLLTTCTVIGVPCSNDPDEIWVQVWISGNNKENDNYTDHTYPEEEREALQIPKWAKKPDDVVFAPHHLPLSVLKHVKEGTTLEFTGWYGTKVRMTFKQKGYRYERFGNFEDVLQHVVS